MQLKYLSISTRETPEIAVYPDSGKFLAYASDERYDHFKALFRADGDLDYWDGEP